MVVGIFTVIASLATDAQRFYANDFCKHAGHNQKAHFALIKFNELLLRLRVKWYDWGYVVCQQSIRVIGERVCVAWKFMASNRHQ